MADRSAPAGCVKPKIGIDQMFLDMFKHKGKFVDLCGKKNLKNYQNLYLMLKKKQNAGEVPVHPENNYLGDNELAKNIYEKKYFVKVSPTILHF